MENWVQHVVKRRAKDGRVSVSQLALEAGVSPYKVRKELERRALKRPAPGDDRSAQAGALDSDTDLARAAKQIGLSAPKLAHLVGCDPQTMARYLVGGRPVPMPILYLIQIALSVGPNEVHRMRKEGAAMHAAIVARHKRREKTSLPLLDTTKPID